jgi:hypothetical protein
MMNIHNRKRSYLVGAQLIGAPPIYRQWSVGALSRSINRPLQVSGFMCSSASSCGGHDCSISDKVLSAQFREKRSAEALRCELGEQHGDELDVQ